MSIATAARLLLSENRDAEFTKLVRRVPVADLDDEKLEKMMLILLSPCMEFNKKHPCRTVITEFNVDEQLEILTRIFFFKSFSDDLLSFIVRSHPEKTSHWHYANLIGYEDRSSSSSTAKKIDVIYGNDITTEKYIELFNYANDDQNGVMMQVIANRIRKYNVTAEAPNWLLENNRKENEKWDIPEPPEYNFTLPSDEEALELLVKVLGEGSINLDTEQKITPPTERKGKTQGTKGKESEGRAERRESEGRAERREENEIEILDEPEISEYAQNAHITDPQVVERFKLMDDEQKRELLEDAFEQHRINILFKSRLYNRLLGPANPQSSATFFDKSHRCYKYGGCRMLICACSEASEDLEQQESMEIDWFTGNCDRCLRKITSRSHAIREPLETGGWRGCYCSSARDNEGKIIEGYCLKAMIHETDPEVNEIKDTFVDQYISVLKKDKIYNRIGRNDVITSYLTQSEYNYNYEQTGFPEVEIIVEFVDESETGEVEGRPYEVEKENIDLAPRNPGELSIHDLADQTIYEALTNINNPLPVSRVARVEP